MRQNIVRNIKTSKVNSNGNKGFTYLELLVSISIFMLLTALIMARENKFQQATLDTNVAYEVGLIIRQTQTRGISILGSTPETPISNAFGVTFDKGEPKKIYVYKDGDVADDRINSIPYGGVDDVIVDQYSIPSKYYIKSFCGYFSGAFANVGTKYCSLDDAGNDNPSIRTLNITFKRPDPIPTIKIGDGATWYTTPDALLILTSGDENEYRIDILNTGQISVSKL